MTFLEKSKAKGQRLPALSHKANGFSSDIIPITLEYEANGYLF